MEPLILFKVVEVLQSTYKAGSLQITEQLNFLLLLMARFRVHPGDYLNILFHLMFLCCLLVTIQTSFLID